MMMTRLPYLKGLIDRYMPRHSDEKYQKAVTQRRRLREDIKLLKRVHKERVADLHRHLRELEYETAKRYDALCPKYTVQADSNCMGPDAEVIHTVRWAIDPRMARVAAPRQVLEQEHTPHTFRLVKERLAEMAAQDVRKQVKEQFDDHFAYDPRNRQ